MSECKYKDEHGHCGLDYEVVFRSFCHEGPCSMEEPRTNGDRIRGMSDDELAEKISTIFDCDHKECPADSGKCPRCFESWLDWLKEEAKT